jgi:hypothetical protein
MKSSVPSGAVEYALTCFTASAARSSRPPRSRLRLWPGFRLPPLSRPLARPSPWVSLGSRLARPSLNRRRVARPGEPDRRRLLCVLPGFQEDDEGCQTCQRRLSVVTIPAGSVTNAPAGKFPTGMTGRIAITVSASANPKVGRQSSACSGLTYSGNAGHLHLSDCPDDHHDWE